MSGTSEGQSEREMWRKIDLRETREKLDAGKPVTDEARERLNASLHGNPVRTWTHPMNNDGTN